MGGWALFELKHALTAGYKLLETIEVWTYDFTTYDPETGRNCLFTGFVNTFMRIKIEASGYPRGCDTDEQRDAYIKHCADVEGIFLDKGNTKFNEGVRQCSKGMINSIWGRLALNKRGNHTSVVKKKRFI